MVTTLPPNVRDIGFGAASPFSVKPSAAASFGFKGGFKAQNESIPDTLVFQRKPNKMPSSHCVGYRLAGLQAAMRHRMGAWVYRHTPFLKQWGAEQAFYKSTANHEMGHALANATANLEMDGLFVSKGGGTTHVNKSVLKALYRSENDARKASPEMLLKALVSYLGGYAAELNHAEEQNLPYQFKRIALNAAEGDFFQAAYLLRIRSLADRVRLKPGEVPLILPQGENGYRESARKFLALPIVEDALNTARTIHRVLPKWKRDHLALEASKKRFYGKSALYKELNRHVSKEEGQAMTQHLEAFLGRHLRP